jgi:serine/threonine protein kinase
MLHLPDSPAYTRLLTDDVLPSRNTLRKGEIWLGSPLGRGGFGITYEAVETSSNRAVAIKEFFLSSCHRDPQSTSILPHGLLSAEAWEQAKAQFLETARVLRQFRHPSIVRIYDGWEENNTVYVAMEHLRGHTLQEIVEEDGPFPEAVALSIIKSLGEALESIHQLGLLHLDIKPENVMVCRNAHDMNGSSQSQRIGRIALFDFDLMQRIDHATGYQTQPLLLHCGTPGYCPLEQYAQHARFGAFTDIYAIGATLYHLLTGQAPPAAPDRALGSTLIAPQDLSAQISSTVNEAILWSLEIETARRPQSVREWLTALREGRPAPPAVSVPIIDDDPQLSWTPAQAAPGFAPQQAPQPLIYTLPPLPQLEGWYHVTVSDLEVEMPDLCSCCGGSADVFFAAEAKVAGWMSTNGTMHSAQQKTWAVPTCKRCARHIRAANQAVRGTTWGMVVGGLISLLGFLRADIWLSPSGIIIYFSAMTYGALKIQYAEELMHRHCSDRKLSVQFSGHIGSKYFLHFRSLAYAHEFRALNADKVL